MRIVIPPAGLGAEAAERPELGDPGAHRLHDPPAAERGAQARSRCRRPSRPRAGSCRRWAGRDGAASRSASTNSAWVETSRPTMMPIVFCASLAPWLERVERGRDSCSRRNSRSTGPGRLPCGAARRGPRSAPSASAMPISGERKMKRIGLTQPPSDERADARLGDRRAAVAAHAARGERGAGEPEPPGDEVPDDGAEQRGEDHVRDPPPRDRSAPCRSSWRRRCRPRTRRRN